MTGWRGAWLAARIVPALVTGEVERSGKSIFFSRGEAWLDGGLLVATAVATMKYLR